MSDPLDVFYWDACIFYEHLNDEPASSHRKLAVKELLLDNKDKRNRICTSVFTHLEIVPKKLHPEVEARYWSQFGSLHFFDIEISANVLMLAREIKDFYYRDKSETEPYQCLSSGDAVHLATAIAYGVTAFHTRDNNKRNGNVPLLGLDKRSPQGLVCGKYPLKIESPESEQGDLGV